MPYLLNAPTVDCLIVSLVSLSIKRVTNKPLSYCGVSSTDSKSIAKQRSVPDATSWRPSLMLAANANMPYAEAAGSRRTSTFISTKSSMSSSLRGWSRASPASLVHAALCLPSITAALVLPVSQPETSSTIIVADGRSVSIHIGTRDDFLQDVLLAI